MGPDVLFNAEAQIADSNPEIWRHLLRKQTVEVRLHKERAIKQHLFHRTWKGSHKPSAWADFQVVPLASGGAKSQLTQALEH